MIGFGAVTNLSLIHIYQDNPSLSARNANVGDAVEALCLALDEWCGAHDVECACDEAALAEALGDASLRPGEKRERAEAALGVEKAHKKLAKAVSSAVVGYAAEFGHVFFAESEGSKFALSNDEKVEAYVCPDEGRDLFDAMRAVHSSYVLMGILSEAQGELLSVCKVGEDVYKRQTLDRYVRRVTATPPGTCPVVVQRSLLQAAAAQTCGKCVPCRDGLPRLAALVGRVADCEADAGVLAEVRALAEMVRDLSLIHI